MLRRILVLLEGTTLADRVLSYATELAPAIGGSLVLVRTLEDRPHVLPDEHLDQRALEAAEAFEQVRVKRLEASGVAAELVVLRHSRSDAVIAEITQQQPDLIVLARPHHPHLSGLFVHDVADRLLAAGVAPVLLVGTAAPGDQSGPLLRGAQLVVLADGSDPSEAALPTAVGLARALRSEVVLFRAVAEPVIPYAPELMTHADVDVELERARRAAIQASQAYLDGLKERVSRQADGLRITTQVRIGRLTEQIGLLQTETVASDPAARGIGLIVMATHTGLGLGGLLLGSTAADVAQSTDLPVVAVPAPRPSASSAAPEPERAARAGYNPATPGSAAPS